MMNFVKNFRNDESGAVTVDWVVLTAAIVGLGVAAISAVNTGVKGLGDDISTKLSTGTSDNTLVGSAIPAATSDDE